MNATNRIQNLYEKILSLRFSDANKVLVLCKELSSLADQTGDTKAKAYSLYYTSDAYITLNQLDDALQKITETIQYIKSHREEELLGSAYNLIGVIFMIRYDHLTAISYYLKALECAHQYDNKQLLLLLYSNIGSIFSDYDSEFGLKYLHLAEQYLDALSKKDATNYNDETVEYNYEVQLINISTALLHSGKYQEALDKVTDYLNNRKNHSSYYHHIAIYYIKLIAYSKLGLIYDMQHVAKDFVAHLTENDITPEFFEMTSQIVKEMIHTGLYDDAYTAISMMANSPNVEESAINSYTLSQLYILYYQKMGDSEQLLKHYRNFYKYQAKRNVIQQNDYIVSIDNKMALEKELEISKYYLEDAAHLEKMTESDSLTGLYNRYGLNKYYDRYFDTCKKEQQVLGLMIIDIDHFKTYNDTQGHLLGDSCIKRLADIIKVTTGDEYYCARYGGDEFFVVCRNTSYVDFQTTASTIVQSVRDAFLPFPESKSGCVTVSIGGILAVPGENHTISDFISSADDALYRIKKTSRDNYYILTSVNA